MGEVIPFPRRSYRPPAKPAPVRDTYVRSGYASTPRNTTYFTCNNCGGGHTTKECTKRYPALPPQPPEAPPAVLRIIIPTGEQIAAVREGSKPEVE